MTDSADNSLDENRFIAERREKLDLLRERGVAFPNDFRRENMAKDLHDVYKSEARWTSEALEGEAIEVALAGRMMAKRVMGKAAFMHIQDSSGQIQVFLQQKSLDDSYDQFKSWDVGDIVGVRGVMMRTKMGELSVRASHVRLLSKSLRPLPDKWHGLSDIETRYRQRYVDLIVNQDSRDVFLKRSKIISCIRAWLDSRDFMEVETPMMHSIAGGATARPFTTHHNALDMDLYLRIAPELYLKRLVVGGFEKVYEINRNFRNEGVSTRHNPEFTMLELYEAYVGYREVMDLTEGLIRDVALRSNGKTKLVWEGQEIDLGPSFKRVSMQSAVMQANPSIKMEDCRNKRALREHCERSGIKYQDGWGWGRLLLEIFEQSVESDLIQPTFITHYPVEVSPLARQFDDDEGVTERFELFVGGKELANGFSELNDSEEQARRFEEQVKAGQGGDLEAMEYDEDYIRALEVGLAPTGGLGIGIDRLVMMLTNSSSIRDVLLFPYMRNK